METNILSEINAMSNKNKIAVLINAILQPAIAGGLNEEEAKRIYYIIMDNISALHQSDNQFNDLLRDITSIASL